MAALARVINQARMEAAAAAAETMVWRQRRQVQARLVKALTAALGSTQGRVPLVVAVAALGGLAARHHQAPAAQKGQARLVRYLGLALHMLKAAEAHRRQLAALAAVRLADERLRITPAVEAAVETLTQTAELAAQAS